MCDVGSAGCQIGNNSGDENTDKLNDDLRR